MKKFFLLLTLLFCGFSYQAFACHGSGISLNSSPVDLGNDEYQVSVNYCIGVTSNFGETNDYTIGYYDINGDPIDVKNVVSGCAPSYCYNTGIGDFCQSGMGGNALFVESEAKVNASATCTSSGNTVVFTNTSTYAGLTGTYGVYDNAGYLGSTTNPPCAPSAIPADATPPFAPDQDDILTNTACTDCIFGWGETSGTNPTPIAVNKICFDLVVTVCGEPAFIAAQQGFEGDGTNNCNGTVSTGPVLDNNDMQEVCSDDTAPCDGDGSTNGTAIVQVDLAVPVELLYFEGKIDDIGAHLTWATASEINNEKFIIERSLDGQKFEEIGQMASQTETGYSLETLRYEYTDLKVGTGLVYYRIVDISYAGEVDYSKIISLKRNGKFDITKVFPSPVETSVSLVADVEDDTDVQLQIIDFTGRVLRELTRELEAGSNTLILDMANLDSGIYFIVMSDGQQRLMTKVMKN